MHETRLILGQYTTMQLLHASWLHSKGIQHRSLATVWRWQWFCDAAHFKIALYQFRQSRMTLSRVKLRRVAHIGTPGWHTGAAVHFLYCNFCSTTGNDEFPSKLRMDSPRSVQSGNPTLRKKVLVCVSPSLSPSPGVLSTSCHRMWSGLDRVFFGPSAWRMWQKLV